MIKLDEKITTASGAWAILRFDPQGGKNYTGVYYIEEWKPFYPAHITSSTTGNHWDRKVVERMMTTLLKNVDKFVAEVQAGKHAV